MLAISRSRAVPAGMACVQKSWNAGQLRTNLKCLSDLKQLLLLVLLFAFCSLLFCSLLFAFICSLLVSSIQTVGHDLLAIFSLRVQKKPVGDEYIKHLLTVTVTSPYCYHQKRPQRQTTTQQQQQQLRVLNNIIFNKNQHPTP